MERFQFLQLDTATFYRINGSECPMVKDTGWANQWKYTTPSYSLFPRKPVVTQSFQVSENWLQNYTETRFSKQLSITHIEFVM